MTQVRASLLIAPHQFPDLDREAALAEEFGLELVAAADQEQFRQEMTNAAVVMVTPYAKVREEEISRLKRCKAIVRYGIGYDNIDARAATAAGVPVTIVPDASTEEVAAHALAAGLALTRRIPQGQAAIAEGRWAGKIAYDAPQLSKVIVGILGMGRIGRITAGWWAALGAQVKAFDPFATFSEVAAASLEDILTNSDVISLHLPLNSETRHLVNAETLRGMRKGCVIVNVSRGGLIDEEALVTALKSGHIAGAALDVFAEEPLPLGHPLRDAPNAILTPHVAWRSNISLGALQQGAVDRARRALLAEPLPDVVTH